MISFVDFLKNNGVHIEDFEKKLTRTIKEDEPENWTNCKSESMTFWKMIDINWKTICEKNKVTYGKEFPK